MNPCGHELFIFLGRGGSIRLQHYDTCACADAQRPTHKSARDVRDVRDEGRVPEKRLLSIHLKEWVEWIEEARKAVQALSLGETDTALQIRLHRFRGLVVQTTAGPIPSSNDVI